MNQKEEFNKVKKLIKEYYDKLENMMNLVKQILMN